MPEKSEYLSRINAMIAETVDRLLPNERGTMSAEKLRDSLTKLTRDAFAMGEDYGINGLMTTEQAADKLGISAKSLRAVIVKKCHQYGIGRQITGNNTWLFRPEEIELLRPAEVGRPWKKK